MTKIEAKLKKSKNLQYMPNLIEPKWQSKWQKEGVYQVDLQSAKQPFYNLMMFPYPSAEGLHIGGVRTFGGVDIYGRFQRMRGKEVFQPFGLDGFGIHAENYALKIGEHPMEHADVTEANYYRQVREAALAIDWSRTVETYKPNYYKWTQWLFLQLFKAGLAYRKKSPVNFCPGCKTVLADEQVIDGKCERCSNLVEKRDLEQWFFRITKYAERLLQNINELNWTDKVRLAQKNWIGKKTGINISYEVENTSHKIVVFTTRPDTNFGATFIALAPEHPLALDLTVKENKKAVEQYIKQAKMKSEMERQAEGKEKTGVFTGSYAINELTGYKMPIWISDFVLAGFGTGALVGVPGHDKRDFEFATKYNLEIKRVVVGKDNDQSPITSLEQVQEDEGTMVNSGFLDRLDIHVATEKIMDYMEEKGYGKREVTYHLRDWLISRQRYWGPPIPMIYCDTCAEKKPKVLIVHGLYGSSNENWFPWLRQELSNRGYDVLVPDLPNADNPKLTDWLHALNKLGITKNDKLFVVGHSLGAPTACQFILKNGFTVEKLILVAPTGNEQGEKAWKALLKNGCSNEGIEAINQFNKANTKLTEVRSVVHETTLYLSADDPYIPLEVEQSYSELNPVVKKFKNKGHFNAASGVIQFAELLEEFAPLDELNMGWHAVPEEQLPVKLPHITDFKPLGTGKAPLANHPEFYKAVCPVCGSEARRETDVSDTFLDSAWYFLRYLATDWDDVPFPSTKYSEMGSQYEKRGKWLPVTSYIGGAEHSVLHLLYARFVTMVLHDLGYLTFEEPFSRFYAHGLVIKDGAKMSKSKGNVITPDVYIRKFGADTVRTYLHFLGPFNQDGDFRDSGIEGMNRFLKRVWALFAGRNHSGSEIGLPAKRIMHQTVKGVTEDMEDLRFNTAIAKLMTWYNFLAKQQEISLEETEVYLKMLAPFAPHMTEELYQDLRDTKGEEGNSIFKSIHTSEWPDFDSQYITKDVVTIAIQINGKLRGTVQASMEQAKDQKAIEAAARTEENVTRFLEEGTIRKVIYIPGKILNYVVV